VVLLNAQTGEVYALASHPSFDANQLAEEWESLMASPNAPLLNRTTQAAYPVGTLMNFLSLAPIGPMRKQQLHCLSYLSGWIALATKPCR